MPPPCVRHSARAANARSAVLNPIPMLAREGMLMLEAMKEAAAPHAERSSPASRRDGTDVTTEPAVAPAVEPPPAASSALIGAGIFLSRLLGLLRQSLIAQYLGASRVADAFNGAFKITNFLQNLFGEGALSASFIPVYANALARGDEEEADRIAGAVGALLALIVSVIVLLGIVFAPAVVKLVVGGFTGETLALTIRLTRILFPGAGVFVMGAWCLGILNSHRVLPVVRGAGLWNVAMIAALARLRTAVGRGRARRRRSPGRRWSAPHSRWACSCRRCSGCLDVRASSRTTAFRRCARSLRNFVPGVREPRRRADQRLHRHAAWPASSPRTAS